MYKPLALLTLVMILGLTYVTVTKKMDCAVQRDSLVIAANTVGIAADDVCYVVPGTNTVECDSGKIFENTTQRESALTGTPGYLSGPGYIGYIVSKPSTPGLMGSGKRVDFYQAQS